MKIRARLALQFALITGTILLLFSVSVYYSTSKNREHEFYTRLRNKALTTAQLLIEVKEVDTDLLRLIDKNTVNALFEEKVSVYDDNNNLVYHHEEAGKPLAVDTSALNLARKNKEYRYKTGNAENIVLLFEQQENKFVVAGAAVDETGLAQLGFLKIILISGLLASIIVSLISGWIFAGQMLVPISEVIAQVGRITARNLSLRVNAGSKKDEIAQLAITFNSMLERLEAAFEMQKRFVANASHELRTPLTAISGQLEVALLKKRTSEEYEVILRSVLDDTRSLGKLANGLLALAQAKADASEAMHKPVRIDELLWQTKEDLLRAHPGYRIVIRFNELPEDEHSLTLLASGQLLKIAFANLMDNACKFSPDNSVHVDLTIRENITLTFRDEGRGIPKEELKQVFQPFYRASNVKELPGHGLGLPLTERIVKLYNGTIDITSDNGKGTSIKITFPLQPGL